ncbi:MAG: hypothetical protein KHZ78_05320 [Peptoniphilus sp. oral taxon 375]|nr:hypothetical protein [Peptoniphilus sp. oral taxon 375]
MELTQEMVEKLIKQKDMERLLVKNLQMEPADAQYLACRLLSHDQEIMDILTAEYKVEVTRL